MFISQAFETVPVTISRHFLLKRKMLHSFVAQVTKLNLKGGKRKKGIKREGDRTWPPFHASSPLICDTFAKGSHVI